MARAQAFCITLWFNLTFALEWGVLRTGLRARVKCYNSFSVSGSG